MIQERSVNDTHSEEPGVEAMPSRSDRVRRWSREPRENNQDCDICEIREICEM